MGKTWGISNKVALWMYKSVLLPQILYASLVWWPKVTIMEAKNLMWSILVSYLRAPVGSMTTTPTETLSNPLFNSPGPGCQWSSQMHCIQIEVSGRMKEYRFRTLKT